MTKVQLSEDEISEFKIEAEELLEIAEQTLLELDKGGDFAKGYDAIFRAFHSVKGAAGMLNWESLQHHMHQLENHFQLCKGEPVLSKQRVTYFLDGLDVCRKILDHQDAEFKYQLPESSNPSETSTQIKLSVPEKPISILKPSTSNENKNIETGVNDSPMVFVIDDEPDIVEILSEMIESDGYKVKGYTQASEAIKDVDKLKPQVVFTDMNMPEMTGSDVLKKIHAINVDIPVIFVSAHLTKQILIDAMGFGVYGAIEKPFKEHQILNICKNATTRFQLWNLLNRSINLVLYQFSGLEDYLTEKGHIEVKNLMVKEMQTLLEVRRKLREVIEQKKAS